MRNDKIWSWFDSDHFADALLGQKEYFIPDTTCRLEHNRHLVMKQLFSWANTDTKANKAADGILLAATEAAASNCVRVVLEIVLYYISEVHNRNTSLPIDLDRLTEIAAETVCRNAAEVAADEDLRYFVMSMASEVPALATAIGLQSRPE